MLSTKANYLCAQELGLRVYAMDQNICLEPIITKLDVCIGPDSNRHKLSALSIQKIKRQGPLLHVQLDLPVVDKGASRQSSSKKRKADSLSRNVCFNP